MRRVLLLGGYGGFGRRIAVRLAGAGWEVLVAGRDRDRAASFCAGRANLVPLALDRDRDLPAVLARERPFALVDAAGPFQGASYEVARACLAAGCHYLDIADGRDFVAGIATLGAEARAAGCAVLSGASSVPALSGAVVRALAHGLDEVREVEMAISASSRAGAGQSVTRAILSYAGRPMRLWRGGRPSTGHGWGELRRRGFAVAGMGPIAPRLVALADVPDLALLPDRLPGRPAVTFRAGTEHGLANRALWLLSGLVRLGLARSLVGLAPILIALQRLVARFGGERSGMVVRVFGRTGGRAVERRWTLVAERGDGPEIPALAAPILLDRLARGTLPPGARDAGALLDLADFEPAFSALSVGHEVREITHSPPLYRRVMGVAFDRLPEPVRAMHDVLRDAGAAGRATVRRGAGWPARLVAAAVGFPEAGEHALHVSFREEDGAETWTRDFGGRRFRSRLTEAGGLLVERFGPLRFAFDLPADEDGLRMRMRGWRLGPLPLPLAWAPRSAAREWAEDGRFWLDVPIALPLIGTVVHYRGWLVPAPASDPGPPGDDRPA